MAGEPAVMMIAPYSSRIPAEEQRAFAEQKQLQELEDRELDSRRLNSPESTAAENDVSASFEFSC